MAKRLRGSKSHPMHKKSALAKTFHPGTRSWRLFFKVQNILLSLGFEAEIKR
jgi:hypothetical protein